MCRHSHYSLLINPPISTSSSSALDVATTSPSFISLLTHICSAMMIVRVALPNTTAQKKSEVGKDAE